MKNLGFPPKVMMMRKDGKQKRKIRVKAETIVPIDLGSVILKKVLSSDAPRSREAFSSVWGIELRAPVISDSATGKLR